MNQAHRIALMVALVRVSLALYNLYALTKCRGVCCMRWISGRRFIEDFFRLCLPRNRLCNRLRSLFSHQIESRL